MYRRTLLAGIGAVVSAGCVTDGRIGVGDVVSDDTKTENMKTGIVEAVAVEKKPEDAEATPRSSIENSHVSDAIAGICDEGEAETQVQVSGEALAAVKTRLGELSSYSPEAGSEYEYGNYVACDDNYVVVRLLLEDTG